MSLSLTIMSLELGSAKGPITKTFTKKEITIGRLPHNDLVLDSPEISAQHARLSIFNGAGEGKYTISITDLGSTNGTHIGSTRLVPHVRSIISPADRIRIGNYLVKLTFAEDRSLGLCEPGGGPERGPRQVIEDREKTEGADFAVSFAEDRMAAKGSLGKEGKESTAPYGKRKNLNDVCYEEQGFSALVRGRVKEQSIEGLNLTAKRLFTLSGKVIHRGKPLSGVTVDAGPLGQVTSGADGRFQYLNVLEGVSYNLSASKPEFRFQSTNAQGTLSGDVEVEFLATKLLSIKGVVTHNGEPLAGVEVDGGPLGKATTDADGCYVFRDVPEDTEFVLKVAKAGFTISCPDGDEALN